LNELASLLFIKERSTLLQKLNRQLERIMPMITPLSVIIGVLFAASFTPYTNWIPWIFAFMTFAGSLGANLNAFKETLKHPFPLFLTLMILHVLMPVYAWGIGQLAFNGDAYTITGIVLGMAIPTGISSLIWVTIYRGNIALTLSIIVIDTILSPFIVPLTLTLMVGSRVEMDVFSIMSGLFGMVVIPSLLGMLLNQATKGKAKTVLSPKLAPFSKIGLAVVVMINAAAVSPYLRSIDAKLLQITAIVFFIAFTGYLLSFFIGKLFRGDRDTVVALTFTGGMRNISAGAVLAVSYFPPPVAVPVVVGMLFQQVLASIYGFMVDRHYSRRFYEKTHTV
jgi:bile acid:Na+ symporter, BASS family